MSDLIERVARAIDEQTSIPNTIPKAYRNKIARATIRVVLEEAAKTAAGEPFGWSPHYQINLYRRWPWRGEGSSNHNDRETVLADEIADAIRALIPKDGE
jgi:hypothetical protein